MTKAQLGKTRLREANERVNRLRVPHFPNPANAVTQSGTYI